MENDIIQKDKLNEIISSYFCSFAKIIKFYFKGNKYEYVFLEFPRLQKYNNQYWDKFTDPVIDRTENLKEFLRFFRASLKKASSRGCGLTPTNLNNMLVSLWR